MRHLLVNTSTCKIGNRWGIRLPVSWQWPVTNTLTLPPACKLPSLCWWALGQQLICCSEVSAFWQWAQCCHSCGQAGVWREHPQASAERALGFLLYLWFLFAGVIQNRTLFQEIVAYNYHFQNDCILCFSDTLLEIYIIIFKSVLKWMICMHQRAFLKI